MADFEELIFATGALVLSCLFENRQVRTTHVPPFLPFADALAEVEESHAHRFGIEHLVGEVGGETNAKAVVADGHSPLDGDVDMLDLKPPVVTGMDVLMDPRYRSIPPEDPLTRKDMAEMFQEMQDKSLGRNVDGPLLHVRQRNLTHVFLPQGRPVAKVLSSRQQSEAKKLAPNCCP